MLHHNTGSDRPASYSAKQAYRATLNDPLITDAERAEALPLVRNMSSQGLQERQFQAAKMIRDRAAA